MHSVPEDDLLAVVLHHLLGNLLRRAGGDPFVFEPFHYSFQNFSGFGVDGGCVGEVVPGIEDGFKDLLF